MLGSMTHFVGLRGLIGDPTVAAFAAANGLLIMVDGVDETLLHEDGNVGLTGSVGDVGIVSAGGSTDGT